MCDLCLPREYRVDQTEPEKQPVWSKNEQVLPIFDDPSEE